MYHRLNRNIFKFPGLDCKQLIPYLIGQNIYTLRLNFEINVLEKCYSRLTVVIDLFVNEILAQAVSSSCKRSGNIWSGN